MKFGTQFFDNLPWKQRDSINFVQKAWDRMSPLPGGRRLFTQILSRFVPYTGSMPFLVEELRPGYARIALADHRSVRNHLRSLHAIALANVSELAGSLALTYSMPDDARFIVKKLNIDYLQKGRGRVIATCTCPVPTTSERKTYEVTVEVHNAAGELVCQTELSILIGPKQTK